MFNVSEAYKTQVKKAVKVRHLHGKLANITFTARDVVLDSFSISNQMTDTGRFSIGETYSAELNITFTERFISEHWAETDINYWKRKVIEIYIDLEVPQESGEIPCSQFRVSDIQKDNGGYHIVAYDLMGRFERKLRFSSTTGQPYDYLADACTNSNMVLGMTRAEVEALPNGTDTITPWKDHGMKTYRDLISAISEYCGCFATIDRYGSLVLRNFNQGLNEPVWTYTNDDLRDDIKTSEFYRKYTAIIGESKSLELVLSSVTVYEDEEAVDIGANPFMQGYDKNTFESKLWNISLGLPKDWHVPCSFSTSQDYCLDLGDKITLPNGDTSYVMSYEFTMQGITITCFGEDTDASTASSGGSDASGGSGKSSETSVIAYHNIREIEVGSEWQSIASLTVYSSKEQTILLNGICKEDSAGNGRAEFKYELNGEELPFTHIEHVWEGDDTQSLIYGIPVEQASNSDIKVYMRMNGTTSTIDAGDLHIYLTGVGLYTSEFNGIIEIEEEFTMPDFGVLQSFDYTDTASVFIFTNILFDISENINRPAYGNPTVELLDAEQETAEVNLYHLDEFLHVSTATGGFFEGYCGEVWLI